MIEVENVSFGYGRETVLNDVNCRMEDGQIVGLIGPNGAGKSTMLRLIAGILKPQKGRILVNGRDAAAYRTKDFARELAFLPQSRPTPAISVRSLVELGRFAHGGGGKEAVQRAIRRVGLDEMAQRDVRTLSGGQRQMAYLAMMLAQEAPNVLLDEPLTHLDVGAQLDVADVLKSMRDQGKCVAVVVHDLAMLDQLCDRAVLVDEGRIQFDGDAKACLRSDALQQAFGVRILENRGVSFEKR